MLELYHNDISVCAQKVRIVLAEKNLEWTSHHINLVAGEQTDPKYLAIHPKGVVPALIDDGRVVLDSLSKVYLCATRTNEALEVQLQGQPVINALLRVGEKPAEVNLNGRRVETAFDKNGQTIRLSVRE